MPTRYSPAFLETKTQKLAAIFAVSLCAATPAWSQNQSITFNPMELDQVTKAVMQDSFLQLRFTALALEGKDETGQALNGLVRAMLARDDIQDAIDELTMIEDDLWYARSAAAISRYFEKEQENTAAALEWLERGTQRVAGVTDPRDGGDIMRILAIRRASLGDLEGAITASRLIPDPTARVFALRASATAFLHSGDADAESRERASALLREAYDQARVMPGKNQSTNRLLIEIGLAQVYAGDQKAGLDTLKLTRERILAGPETGRSHAITELAAAYVEGGDMRSAMEVVRLVPEGAPRSEALGSVARAMSVNQGINAAVPLFRLAVEQAETVENNENRDRAYAHLIVEQTRVGRLRDAFSTAGLIKDRRRQARALLGMGRQLVSEGKFEETQRLTEFIPFTGMRAELFAKVAMNLGGKGEKDEASALLARALEATGFEPLPEFLPDAIDLVLDAQIDFGQPYADDAIFTRARDLVDGIPGDADQVRALVRVAIAEARRGLGAKARKSISAAYRTAFENKDEPGFDEALQDISLAQIATGDILSSFDTAARIEEPSDEADIRRAPDGSFLTPRFRALTRVAAAAARIGETDLAIRAANRMEYPPARSAALAAVAVALASPESDLLEIIGDAAKSDVADLGGEAGLRNDLEKMHQ